MDALPAFLETFAPRQICHACLVKVLTETETRVTAQLAQLQRAGRAEEAGGPCLNCGEKVPSYRHVAR